MNVFLLIFCIIYVISILALPMFFGEHNVSFTIWSLLVVLTPIINTVLCICFIIKDIDTEKLKTFCSLERFLNDIRDD